MSSPSASSERDQGHSDDDPTVFIVDDDEAFRDSLRELVSSVGLSAETFASAQEFLDAFDPARPGCLVTDLRMPRMNGLALHDRLRAIGAHIPVIFVSGHGDIATAVQTIKSGAVDFVPKPCREQDLLDAIEEALRRGPQQLPAPSGTQVPDLDRKIAALTTREREVMALALKGGTSKSIAHELKISYRTVEQHRSDLLKKIGVSNTVALMRLMGSRSQ